MASKPKAHISLVVKGETDEVVYQEFFEEFKEQLHELCGKWHMNIDSYDFHIMTHRKCMY